MYCPKKQGVLGTFIEMNNEEKEERADESLGNRYEHIRRHSDR